MNAPQPQFQLRSSDLPSVNTLKRMLAARVIAGVLRDTPSQVIARLWPHDRITAEIELIGRATSAPAMTSVPGWAQELAQRRVVDTLDALGPVSAGAQLMQAGMVLSFDGAGSLSVPGFVASVNDSAWVAEGDPIPVQQMAAGPGIINPYKIGSISVLSREMVESSNAEQIISNTLVRAAGLALDAVLFDANPATAARPAGLRNGIAATTASASTDAFQAALEDIGGLIGATSAVGGVGPYVVIANPGRAAGLHMRYYSYPENVTVLGTPAVGNDMIVVAVAALAGAISPDPDVETSRAATLQMSDTPVAVGGAGPVRGLWQTDSIGVKVRWPASWTLRDPRGVAWTSPTWK